MSFTHMATRSIPTVSNFPGHRGHLDLGAGAVGSGDKDGFAVFPREGNRKKPAKPPIPPMTSFRFVVRTIGLIRETSRSPSSMSTPASLYVTVFFKSGAPEGVYLTLAAG